jgi:hypothetical protein
MRRNYVMIIISYFLVVLGFELLLHWFFGRNIVPTLTNFYLSDGKKDSITTLVDNFLPGIVLGLANGWFGKNQSLLTVSLSAGVLDVGIVASELLYLPFFRVGSLWWWPLAAGDIIFRILTTLVFVGLFTYAGWRGGQGR